MRMHVSYIQTLLQESNTGYCLYIDFNIYGFFNKTFSLMPLLKDDTNAKLLTFCNSLSYYNILTFR